MIILALTLVTVLAALRLTRLFTQDVIFERLVMTPLRKRTGLPFHEISGEERLELPKAAFALSVFDCVWCAGFWASVISVAVAVALTAIFSTVVATVVLAPLALSYIVGHLGGKLDAA